jgi:hypothetical protein
MIEEVSSRLRLVFRAAVRVAFWGTLAMDLTAAVDRLFGTVV